MEKARRKGRTGINIIDIFIILIILAAAAALVYVFLISGRGSTIQRQTQTIRYVVEIKDVRNEFTSNITEGEKAIDSVAMFDIGTIVAYEVKDATRIGVNRATSEIVASPYPERQNMYITIEAEAYLDKYVYSIGGYMISVGSPVGLKLPNFLGSGFCIKIDVID